jgi:hypothetical protein
VSDELSVTANDFETWVREQVDQAPELRAEQVTRLSAILRPPNGKAVA